MASRPLFSRIPLPEVALVLAAMAFAFAMLLYATAWNLEWTWFHPWVLAPYPCWLAIRALMGSEGRRVRIAALLAAAAMLLLTVFFYVNSLMVHSSSTSPLIFIFAPIYILFGAGATLFLAYALGHRWERT